MSEQRLQQPELPVPEPAVPPPPPAPEPVPAPTPEPAAPPTPKAPDPAPAAAVPSTLQPSLVSEATVPAAPPPPAFEAYTLPDGVSMGEAETAELNRIISAADLTPQQRGQALVDLAVAEISRIQQGQFEAFSRTREEWRNQFYADPEIGGNRQETTLRAAAQIRDRFAGTDQQRAEFVAALNHTGIGDHPAFIRFLANVARELAAPRLVAAQPSPQPSDGPGRRYPTMVR